MTRPLTWLLAFAALPLAACNTAPVLPPEDDRLIEIVETDLWSGGEVRAVVRFADMEESPVEMTLDGEALTVSRVDDTTFAATLPVHTGGLPIRVTREGLEAVERSLTLHGYVSGIIGPAVGGPVLRSDLAGAAVVLGSNYEGAVEVSLETGQVVRNWPLSVHSLKCGVGVVPGPGAGQVLLRPSVGGSCQSMKLHAFTTTGLGPVLETAPWASSGITAIVGPWTTVMGAHDNAGVFLRCKADPPWGDCGEPLASTAFNFNVRGWEAGYQAQRIFGLGIKTALHDLLTGDVVTILPHFDGGVLLYHSAAFSPSEDTLFVAAFRNPGNNGKLLLLDSETGSTLEEVVISDGRPIAVAPDANHNRLLLLMHDAVERKLWLRVLDASSHSVLADLPAPTGEIETAVWQNEHNRLVLNAGGTEVFAVTTRYKPSFSFNDLPGMGIARWSLP